MPNGNIIHAMATLRYHKTKAARDTTAAEKRTITASAPTTSGRTVSGYAAKFNKRSRTLRDNRGEGFIEIIKPGAFDGCDMSDVRCFFNHDQSAVLARSKGGRGTLKLAVDSIGLRYEFQAPNTQLGNDTLELIRRGDLDESSFAFTISPGGDSWTREGDMRIRTIHRIAKLHDVSICSQGAYPDTPVSARSKQPAKAMTAGDARTRHALNILRRIDRNRPQI